MHNQLTEDLDDSAWEQLLADTVSEVVGRLRRRNARDADPEEIGGEVSYRLLRYRRSSIPPSELRAIAWTIARRCTVDQYRIKRCAKEHAETTLAIESAINIGPGIPTDQIQARLHDALLDVLLQLPYQHRLMVWMRFFDGATYAQIARASNMSVTTVRRRLRDCLNRLDSALRSRCADDPIVSDILDSLGICF